MRQGHGLRHHSDLYTRNTELCRALRETAESFSCGGVMACFSPIAVEIETLKKEFENCTELSLRVCLALEVQAKLREMNRLLDQTRPRLSGFYTASGSVLLLRSVRRVQADSGRR